MKRTGNVYNNICSLDNLRNAELRARKGKTKQKGVKRFDRNKDLNLEKLSELLVKEDYRTSPYRIFDINEGKLRTIYELPYYPDRIVHHSIMIQLEDIFVKSFTSDTYSCIKKRGIHKCLNNLTKALKNKRDTKYCLKIDIKKFYPNIDHEILKSLLRRKFKDPKLLKLLDEIIDSAPGLPIGNYLSQFFANFYLNGFDHWIKTNFNVKYFRYCDDIVILHSDKAFLHNLRKEIQIYLESLKLELSNYQVFPVESRGIDFVGYVSYHDYIFLRKSIKTRFKRMIRRYPNRKSKSSYNGWLSHCNSLNLKNKYYGNR